MGGYDKRGSMVLPVTNENGMNNVTLPEVTVTPRNINLAGAVDRGRREAAPYVSTLLTGAMFGPLPVLSGAIGSTTVDEATRELSKGKYNTWGDILNSTPKIETSATLGEQPGIGLYRQSYSVNKDVMDKLTDAQAQDVGAHELVHYMYRPSKEQEAELAYNVRQYFKRPEGRDYFRQSRQLEEPKSRIIMV